MKRTLSIVLGISLLLFGVLALAACSAAGEGNSSSAAASLVAEEQSTSAAASSVAEEQSTSAAASSAAQEASTSAVAAPAVQEPAVVGTNISYEGYQLKKVVVLSRHNIRSPLSGKDSILGSITPHDWFAWSSDPSDLSLRGGVLETEMGQYFRRWLEAEGLFPQDYRPEADEVRIYANSKQRTIATAEFFESGLLPIGVADVEYHVEFDTMDPVFNPQLTFISEGYKQQVQEEIDTLFGESIAGLADNYELISDVIDAKDSPAWEDKSFTGFQTDDMELVLEKDAEPAMTGSLKTACSVSDALVLQYYETDEESAAFGKKLTPEQWDAIAEIKDIYQDVLFSAPSVAVNVAHPLLQEIQSELSNDKRLFTFLCGHDSNLGSVLAALSVKDYSLPNALEKKTPIGSKLVFSCWEDASGAEYISVDLVYQSADQLRGLTLLDVGNPPMTYHFELEGLTANEQGLYEASAFLDRLQQSIQKYDEIAQE